MKYAWIEKHRRGDGEAAEEAGKSPKLDPSGEPDQALAALPAGASVRASMMQLDDIEDYQMGWLGYCVGWSERGG